MSVVLTSLCVMYKNSNSKNSNIVIFQLLLILK